MRDLASFKDIHRNESVVVCGCGSSLSELVRPDTHITIGVNDIGRLFDPTYLVVLNPPSQFKGDRFRWVESSKASYLFSQLDLRIPHPAIVRIKLGRFGGTDSSDPSVLHFTQNSPYVALCLAAIMGAKKIGLIGVDFTDHHFFGATGAHPLAAALPQIDRQYRALNAALRARGIEVVNLSARSRLTAFTKGTLATFGGTRRGATVPSLSRRQSSTAVPRTFFVHYRFLACGDVFTTGLTNAARELNAESDAAYWDDPLLKKKIETFNPDLLFVVHGRRFAARWGTTFKHCRSAVWLLDEPYEVDDSAIYSRKFDMVFVNDWSTVHRHCNARYLPVCFDPLPHFYGDGARTAAAGFAGGHNDARERMLLTLVRAGCLSWCAGGPWQSGELRRRSRGLHIPPETCADFYRSTRIIVNVFRTQHHFNRSGIVARSANPRIYEALACGALVVSEPREEIGSIFPELPTFTSPAGLEQTVTELLDDTKLYDRIIAACRSRLVGHTYADRLRQVFGAFAEGSRGAVPDMTIAAATFRPPVPATVAATVHTLPAPWKCCGITPEQAAGIFVFQKPFSPAPGSEQGIVTETPFENIELVFTLRLEQGSVFVAKVHQERADNQLTNSYHLVCSDTGDYLARHNLVLHRTTLPRTTWVTVGLIRSNGSLSLRIDGSTAFVITDTTLKRGYAFLGIKGGRVALRDITVTESALRPLRRVAPPRPPKLPLPADHEIVFAPQLGTGAPAVSIVTTVYNRLDCLQRCIGSVQAQTFRDFEQIIVADCPPPPVAREIIAVARDWGERAPWVIVMKRRHNDWGIRPAETGLVRSRGPLVAFLSDDNGYMPDHLAALVDVLNNHPEHGFAYSSCLYDGRKILNAPVPAPARIDLGQPLFRRSVLERHLGLRIPFAEFAWDWRLIRHLMQSGVTWRHVDRATFIFRLQMYPELMPPVPARIGWCPVR